DARRARHLREAEAHQLWNHFGYISILEYLEREHGIEPRTASDRLRVSHALADLPLLEAELEEGTFQYSHVKELTRVATPETEDEWIAAARGKTCGEVQAMVAGHKPGDGPDDPDDPDLRLRNLVLKLPPQTLAMYREQLAAIEAELGHRLEEAEAFRIMMERVRDCREGASTPAQISICSHCERGWQDGAGFRAELDPAAMASALCDADHLGSVDAEPGRKKPTLSKRKRQRILARDHHRCAVPGCRSAKNLDLHHIVHQENGGGHEDWNLVTLCSGHHAAHHRGDLAIEGRAPKSIRFAWKHRTRENAHVGSGPVGRRPVGTGTNGRVSSRFEDARMRSQARDALAGLGWKPGIARAAVDEAIAHVGIDVRIEQLIHEALRRCPRPG
ncbi:MAG: hypothetical protein H0T42_15700, partial [Deltaproteobacteria bacterium]|nr:hypothetical protein [Deltaproteobacteria bacterium]